MSNPSDSLILAVDQSALEFYFESVLPEISDMTRSHMARAIRAGIKAQSLQERIEEALRIDVAISQVRDIALVQGIVRDRIKQLEATKEAL